jgi:hypothetical protein
MVKTAKNLKGTSIAATDGDIGSVQDLYFDRRGRAIRPPRRSSELPSTSSRARSDLRVIGANSGA